MLPGFGPGQGIISGQAVRFPLLVKIRMDEDLVYTDLGDENFLAQAREWKPDKHAPVRERVAAKVQKLSGLPDRRPKGKMSGSKAGHASFPAAADTVNSGVVTEAERWEKARKNLVKDQRAMGDLEAATGLEWVKGRRKEKVSEFASKSWDKLKEFGLSNRHREGLLALLEAAAN